LPAFSNYQSWERARELIYGVLNCVGRQTITGMLAASGNQFKDWSSAYRLFSKQRVDIQKIMNIIQANVLEETSTMPAIVAHMDDTIIKKTGRRIPGTAWRRDPLGPPFHTNFIWGQRFLQLSLALPRQGEICQSRSIPIDFHHCPTAIKPKKAAGEDQWNEYNEQKKKLKLSKQGSERIVLLRQKLDANGAKNKQLIISVDGSYTNKEVLKKLPERVTIIGRIRKDTKLYRIPENQPEKGRKRVYGEQLPTPEEIRQSDLFDWEEVLGWAAGKTHKFNVKVVKNVRWRPAGEKHNLMLIVIRPLGYRLTKTSKILYREPAYLICTDTQMNVEKLIQDYLWRWEIEVNFREQKTILGCGQAQVRNPNSVESVPAFITAIYSILHIASHRAFEKSNNIKMPRPKWYIQKENQRVTTGDLMNNVRANIFAKAIGVNFSDLVNKELETQSLRNDLTYWNTASLYVRN